MNRYKDEKKICCGCGICEQKCPQQAINLKEDKYGFLYPQINEMKCINCGICEKVCPITNDTKLSLPVEVYAAGGGNVTVSSSGGMFAALAEAVITQGGIVCGCVFNEDFKVVHICTDDYQVIQQMYGSKYVQSDITTVLEDITKYLKEGRKVLFSGTPCQVDAVKKYVGIQFMNLYTCDVICHGVPNARMFQEYLDVLKKKYKIVAIKKFVFRDKSQGWSCNSSIKFLENNGKVKIKKISNRLSSYYTYFLDGEIYRDSCYSCKYAQEKRCSDITIGDYWGITQEEPEYKKYKLDIKEGVSVVLINSEKGKELWTNIQNKINSKISTIDKAKKRNEPLNAPSKHSELRKNILMLYEKEGWSSVDKTFNKNLRWRSWIYRGYNIMPIEIKDFIRVICKKR